MAHIWWHMSLGLSYPVPMIGAANAVAGIVGVMTAIWKSWSIGEYFVSLQCFYFICILYLCFHLWGIQGANIDTGIDFLIEELMYWSNVLSILNGLILQDGGVLLGFDVDWSTWLLLSSTSSWWAASYSSPLLLISSSFTSNLF